MSFTVIPSERRTVVRIDDERLDISNAPPLRTQLQTLLEAGSQELVVDFGAVSFVDSSGLGVLLSAMRVAARTGGTLRVAGIRPEVRALFELAQMHRVLDISAGEGEARAS